MRNGIGMSQSSVESLQETLNPIDIVFLLKYGSSHYYLEIYYCEFLQVTLRPSLLTI